MKSNSKRGSESFWNAIKPFFTNRGIITNDTITIEENRHLNSDPKETTEVFNNYYVNIEKTISGKRPSSIGNSNSQCQDELPLKRSSNLAKIIQCCNHKRKSFARVPEF